MERLSQEQQYMGTSRTIAHSPIVKRIPLSPPLDEYKSPLGPMSKLSSPSPLLSHSKLEFHSYTYIDFAVPTSFPHTPQTSMSDYSVNASNESPATMPPQSPTLPIPFNPVATTAIPTYPPLLPQTVINVLASQPNLNETIQAIAYGLVLTVNNWEVLHAQQSKGLQDTNVALQDCIKNFECEADHSFELPSIPLGMRTTTGRSPHRSPSEGDTMPMPSGSSSMTTAMSTSSLGRTSTRSPTPLTSSSTHHIQMRSLHCSLAGSATYSLAPLPLTTPYARQYLTSTTGMPSQRWSTTTAMMTTTDASPMSSHSSNANLPSLMMPLPLPATIWKQHKFLLSFLTLRDMPSPSPTQDIALLTNVATAVTLMMDQELHSRREGDVIALYRWFNVRAVGGRKHKSPGDYLTIVPSIYCLPPYC